MRRIRIILLAFSIGICFLAGGIGSLFTFSAIPAWYAALQKPFFNPPNWLFGPVWSTLYFLMGVSLYLILNKKSQKKEKRQGLAYFFVQLFLNALWSIIFFGFHLPVFAFLEIIILWIMIFFTIKYFLKVVKTAGWLLIPYLAWVSFAGLLNLSIAILNR